MYPRGVIAMIAGMMLLLGHTVIYILTTSNSNISPASKSDIVALIVPLTVASLTSAAIYATKHSGIRLRDTPKANLFFVLFALLLPAIVLTILVHGIYNLDSDLSVKNFKLNIVICEAIFGASFAIMSEAIFGKH